MTKGNVVLIGLIALSLGGIGYGLFLFLGLDAYKAGIASEAILVLVVCAWIASYFFRVLSGKMTFMEQRKRYRDSYEKLTNRELEEKFDSMSKEEQRRLLQELEIDKK